MRARWRGRSGSGVRTGVTEALRQFVELIRSPSGERGPGREVYAALGAGELREGRTLDALQSAYRVGARVAWRRLAAAATRAGVEPEVLSLLAESIFAYIEELSADSVEGYAEARSRLEGERRRRRRELVTLLVRDPPAERGRPASRSRGGGLARSANGGGARVRRGAARAPRRAAARRRARRRSGRHRLRDRPRPRRPGPARGDRAAVEAPRRAARWARPVRLARSAPPGRSPARRCEPSRPARSRQRAWSAWRTRSPSCCCSRTAALVERLAARRLAAFDALTPKARRRMEETALAYVQQQGNAAAMSRALGVHAQTARYRLSRLRELLGDALDDPDARFELELALRARL